MKKTIFITLFTASLAFDCLGQQNIFPTPSGSVGIGTASPQTKLHVVASAQTDRITVQGSLSNSNVGFMINNQNGTERWSMASVYAADFLQFYKAGYGNVMVLRDNGMVGIGTSSPSEILHVSGAGDVEQLIEATDNGYASLTLQSNNKRWHWSKRPGQYQDALQLYYHNGTAWSLPFFTALPGGNVGIGSSTPAAKLQINGNGAGSDVLNIIENANSAAGAHFLSEGGNNIKFQLRSTADNAVNTELRTWGNSFINALQGNVGIGTTNPQSKLAVKGVITAQEVSVTMTGWSDYVFEEDYALIPLRQLEEYIKKNKHLPDVPTADEVIENGLRLGESDALLLKKIEELTLYIIQMEKRVKALEGEMHGPDERNEGSK